jgi:prophage regulatory protein
LPRNSNSPGELAVPEVFVSFAELPNYGVPKYTRVHLYRLMRRGQFPKAIQLSPNRVAWTLSSLQVWVATRPIARSAEPRDVPGRPGRPVGSKVIGGRLVRREDVPSLAAAAGGGDDAD